MGDIRFDPVFNIGNIASLGTTVISILGMIWWLSSFQATTQLTIAALVAANAESRSDVRMLLNETARIRERLAAIEVILNRQEGRKEAKNETPPR